VFAGLAPLALAGPADNSVRFASRETLEHADPYFNSQFLGQVIADNVWDTLIRVGEQPGEFVGNLATAWRWLGERTLELDLRTGVRFHDGAEFVAADVASTFDFVRDPGSRALNRILVECLERVEVVDPHKVRLIFREPFPAALSYLSHLSAVIHPHEYYAAVGPRGVNERPIGTGPYRVVEHVTGTVVRLARNDDYFAGGPKRRPAISSVEIRRRTRPCARRLRRGEEGRGRPRAPPRSIRRRRPTA
jgi:peptide/nickel transport system substrate-binding protein